MNNTERSVDGDLQGSELCDPRNQAPPLDIPQAIQEIRGMAATHRNSSDGRLRPRQILEQEDGWER